MSEQERYSENDPQWSDLPVPDSEGSWQAMKAKLDEEEERKPAVPLWVGSCAPWAVLGGVALIIAFFFVRPGDRLKNEGIKSKALVQKTVATRTTVSSRSIDLSREKPVFGNPSANQTPATNSLPAANRHTNSTVAVLAQPIGSKEGGNTMKNSRIQLASFKPWKKQNTTSVFQEGAVPAIALQPNGVKNNIDTVQRTETLTDKQTTTSTSAETTAVMHRGVDTTAASSPAKMDNAAVPEPTTIDTAHVNNKQASSRRFYLSAGVGLQQQIRSSGQEAYAKSYSGKGGLGDHIPSVYLRVHKGDRWFLQGEFRFGAPQLVPGFAYSQQTRYDTANSKVDVTRLQLKKLYYHQLPLSINYSPLKNWSIGTGVVFSRFYRAVVEQQVESKSLATGMQTATSSIVQVPAFRDSFLYKTQVRFLVQTEYQLGRLALGLRYKRDAQSYIRYTRPDGTVVSERGEALEAVLRFRLWQNKKK